MVVKVIFSIPRLEEMIKRKYSNGLNFEHTVFLTEPYVEYLFSRHGFKKIDKQYFCEDHSIFYAFEKHYVDIEHIPNDLYKHNKKLYLDYISYYELLIKDLNTKIDNINKNCVIYLFGAHVFSQLLINCG